MDHGIILAGGKGKRMKAEKPKPLFEILGMPMLEWVIRACEGAGLTSLCVVKGFCGEQIDTYLSGRYPTVLQAEQKGTGHAVMQARAFLSEDTSGSTLVLCGDAPFLDSDTIRRAREQHEQEGSSVTVITAVLDKPRGYGRILRNEKGIAGIVEEKDATESQRAIREINSGAYWFKTADLLDALDDLGCSNAAGEYYLTDTVAILLAQGKGAGAYCSGNADVILGANSQRDLLELNTLARMQVIGRHLDNGVTFPCTDGILISPDTRIGAGTVVYPNTILRGGNVIGKNCIIGPGVILEECTVEDGCRLENTGAVRRHITASDKM